MKSKFKAKKFWWLILIIILVGGFIFNKSRVAKAKEIKDKSYTVVRQDLIDSLDIAGEIDAREKASLRFQTSGLLTWVGVKEGDTVKKYQVLASLDKRELQNQMSQLLNNYSKTRADFDQTQIDNRDWESNTQLAQDAIKRSLKKEQLDLDNSVLTVEAKNLALKFATRYTPIEGVVTKVEAPLAGQNITPATATFEVVNLKSFYFSSIADQTEVTKFKIGQKGIVVLDSFPDVNLNATVESIAFSPKAGESGTVYEIKIAFESTPELAQVMRMGMTGDSKFVFKETKNVLVVPAAYIKTENGKSYVTMMTGDKKTKVEVTTGESIDGQIEIRSGINENDIIYSN